jgi:hypothetical protein
MQRLQPLASVDRLGRFVPDRCRSTTSISRQYVSKKALLERHVVAVPRHISEAEWAFILEFGIRAHFPAAQGHRGLIVQRTCRLRLKRKGSRTSISPAPN